MMTTSEMLDRGLAHVSAGEPALASALFRQVLALEPRNNEALLHLAAVVKGESGAEAVVACVREILEKDPGFLEALVFFGSLLRTLGRTREVLPFILKAARNHHDPEQLVLAGANFLEEEGDVEGEITFLKEALQIWPEAFQLLEKGSRVSSASGRHEEALGFLRRMVELRPISAEALCSLGNGLDAVGKTAEAMDCYATAIHVEPDSFVAFHLLGTELFSKKEYLAAIGAFQKALELAPSSLHTLSNLGVALVKTGKFAEGIEILRFVVDQQPEWPAAWLHLAIGHRELGAITEALHASKKALELNPKGKEALLQRSATLLRAGYSAESAKCLETVHLMNPEDPVIHSDSLFTSNYLPDLSAADRFHNYRQFSRIHEAVEGKQKRVFGNQRDLHRKLRIGYVSGDFRLHSVAFFVEPILRAHDRKEVEVFAYSNRPRQDKISDLLKSLSDHWREVYELNDAELETLIKHDEIDVLVDLSGHTAHNRLTCFARKPAPVQFTMVGCMQTTGLDAVDYRITDEFLDPEGLTEGIHSEKLTRLSAGAFCFAPPPTAPAVGELPAKKNGWLTFASFNNTAKVTPEVVGLWRQVLEAVPTSRLLLVGEKDNIAARFLIENGVAEERITVLERRPVNGFLEVHQQVDVLLDTFPYNGLTVTLFAAWMGVPCLTLEGVDAASRAGSAINKRLGLVEFVASNYGEFVDVAKRLSGDFEALDTVRQALREKTRTVYCDRAAYTRELEGAFRKAWQDWCLNSPAQRSERESLENRVAKGRNLLAAGLAEAGVAELKAVLLEAPEREDVLGLLADVAMREGRREEAIEFMERVLRLTPDSTDAIEKTAKLLFQRGGYPELERLYLGLLEQRPGDPKWMNGIADIYRLMERKEDALNYYRKAVDVGGTELSYRDSLANYLLNLQRQDEALEVLEIEGQPEERSFSAWMTAGTIYFAKGRLIKARDAFRKAIGIRPNDLNPRANLGAVLKELFLTEDSLAILRASLRIDPNHVEMLNNLANSLQQDGEVSEAEAIFRKAIEVAPNSVKAHINLGGVLCEMGRNVEAIECFRNALALEPNSVAVASNLCFVLNYLADVTPEEVFAEYRRFSDSFEVPLRAHTQPYRNERSYQRRIRIGYVSADFRDHSVAYFVEPLLKGYDREKFEVFCYYNFAVMDEVTERLRSYVDHWHSIHCVPDEVADERIRKDGIDILVELSGHTSGSRLLLFARKPAPVQVTMIGCMQSSGLVSMDYRIADSWMDPEGLTEHLHTEKLLRLTKGAFCLEPLRSAPEVNELPALKTGAVRFASFNNLAKITPKVVEAWAAILKRIPTSRFLVVGRGPERIRELMSEMGVDPQRIDISKPLHPSEYLAMHHEVDVILDSFPYNGLTITSLAAWMGVPCVTIEGSCAAARAGSAIMRRLGLPEFVALDEAGYVDAAERMAADIPKLAGIRRELRERCRRHLANTSEYVNEVETVFAEIWKRWCLNA